VDRTGWVQTTLGSLIVPKITYEEPIPDLDPDYLPIVDRP
jgi:hypothetical protein